MNNEYLQLGTVAILFLISIKEFFFYLRSKKNGNGELTTADKKVFDELKNMNDNHLHSIENAIIGGNREIVKAISDGNIRIVELLGEIRGNLNR